MVWDVIVVGAGLSGCVCAERFANVLKKKVLVLDKRDHIGGNCYDYVDEETKMLVSKYGPHLFHTNDERVFDYVSKFSKWKRYDHKCIAQLDNGKRVNLPVNINTVNTMFFDDGICLKDANDMQKFMKTVSCSSSIDRNAETSCLERFGKLLYENIFCPYTTKQWNRAPTDLDASIVERIPLRFDFDDRYFSDRFQMMPTEGYTRFFKNLLDSSPLIETRLCTDYFAEKEKLTAPIVIFTGPIDQYFEDAGLEKLEYRSLRFELERHETRGFVQTHAVVNYPSEQYDFTRITEYKHMFDNDVRSPNHSITVKEYPSDEGPEYYPVVNERNMKLYDQYASLAKAAEKNGVFFLGRLASFKYVNMDQAISNALRFFEDTFDYSTT